MDNRVIVITGPTATGKTGVAVETALAIGGEVVSADSMQIYRGMDIGTAKVRAGEMKNVPHHMIDVASPWENYSVSRYVEEASRACDDILARGKTPVIAGGTGLYIDSLIAGREFAGNDGDAGIRAGLEAEYDQFGGAAMLKRLGEVDPERAAKLFPGDKRRLVRAMEVFLVTGETITSHDERTRQIPPRYEALRFALSFEDRADLYERIDRRVDQMMEDGLLEEVTGLLGGRTDFSGLPTAWGAIGYKEILRALAGELSLSEAVELIKMESRRYAKRQLTWLRRREDVAWILWQGAPDIASGARKVLESWGSAGMRE